MKGFRTNTAVAAFLLFCSISAVADSGLIVSHFEPIQVVDSPMMQARTSQLPERYVELTFDALGRSFELQLESNDRLFGQAARASRDANVAVYKGRLAGNSGSWARITIADGAPRGLIWDGAELFAIEAPGDSTFATTAPVIFRLSDTYIQPGTMSCGTEASASSGESMYSNLTRELQASMAQAPGATMQIDIGAIGDFEFFDRVGAGSETAIMARLNNVDGIFSSQTGVQISVAEIIVYTDDSSDPLSNTTNPNDLLIDLGQHRQLTPAQYSQGLTHLYTGRDLDGSTVGIAYTNALCSGRFGAGLSEGRGSVTFDSLIAAHEIGHNFAAPHDGDPDFSCGAEPETFIMAPSINGSDQFSQCSIGVIQAAANSASCVFDLPTTDMTIELRGQAPSALLGGGVVMNFDATNLGSETATNVAVDISIPSNFSLVSSTSTGGSCTNGAGTVNCTLGSAPGGTTDTITLSTIANDTSSGTFVATVSSDVDDNAANNEETVVITPLPAADMAVSVSNAVVVVNQGTSALATIENLNTTNALNVTVSITLDNGLQADSANWSAGSCTVSANQVDCQASSIAGLSSSTLTLGVTGLSVGQRGYTMTLASSGNEANPDNNTATGNVTVNNVSASDPESSSGSAGLIFLALLGLVRAAKRRFRGQPTGAGSGL